MQIKKKYNRPIIESISIDHSISLVMASSTDEEPITDPYANQSAQSEPIQQNSFESNPFEE